MNLELIAKTLNLQVRAAHDKLNTEVRGGYTGDLLSDVIGNSNDGDIWITRQIHQNIVAVASLKSLAGIVLVQGSEPTTDTIDRANREGIPLMTSELTSFQISGRIYNLLHKEV